MNIEKKNNRSSRMKTIARVTSDSGAGAITTKIQSKPTINIRSIYYGLWLRDKEKGIDKVYRGKKQPLITFNNLTLVTETSEYKEYNVDIKKLKTDNPTYKDDSDLSITIDQYFKVFENQNQQIILRSYPVNPNQILLQSLRLSVINDDNVILIFSLIPPFPF